MSEEIRTLKWAEALEDDSLSLLDRGILSTIDLGPRSDVTVFIGAVCGWTVHFHHERGSEVEMKSEGVD